MIYLVAFLLSFVDEWVATRRTLSIADRSPYAWAWAALYVLVLGPWAYVTVHNLWTLIPSAMAAALANRHALRLMQSPAIRRRPGPLSPGTRGTSSRPRW